MLLLKSGCVYIQILSVSFQGIVWPKYHFWPFFGTDIKIEISVVIYMHLNHSPDYVDSKYIWFHGINSLGSSVFAKIPFLAFFTLHRGGGGVARWDLAHFTPRVKFYMYTKF